MVLGHVGKIFKPSNSARTNFHAYLASERIFCELGTHGKKRKPSIIHFVSFAHVIMYCFWGHGISKFQSLNENSIGKITEVLF